MCATRLHTRHTTPKFCCLPLVSGFGLQLRQLCDALFLPRISVVVAISKRNPNILRDQHGAIEQYSLRVCAPFISLSLSVWFVPQMMMWSSRRKNALAVGAPSRTICATYRALIHYLKAIFTRRLWNSCDKLVSLQSLPPTLRIRHHFDGCVSVYCVWLNMFADRKSECADGRFGIPNSLYEKEKIWHQSKWKNSDFGDIKRAECDRFRSLCVLDKTVFFGAQFWFCWNMRRTLRAQTIDLHEA